MRWLAGLLRHGAAMGTHNQSSAWSPRREALMALGLFFCAGAVVLALVWLLSWVMPPAPRSIDVTVKFDAPIQIELLPPRPTPEHP